MYVCVCVCVYQVVCLNTHTLMITLPPYLPQKVAPVIPVSHSLPLSPVALQVAAWFVIGSIYDLISPRTALLLPEIIVLVLHLINYGNCGKLYIHFHSYLSSIKVGLLGK